MASATDVSAGRGGADVLYLSTENHPDLVNYYLYYPDANVILSAHSAARAAQNSPFYAAVQAYTSQETAIYTLDVDGRIGFLFPFDSHFILPMNVCAAHRRWFC